jgi:hypothetical protein
MPAIIGSAVPGLSAAISGISGSFDSQFARPDLGAGFVAAQVAYVIVARLAGAANRLWALLRQLKR